MRNIKIKISLNKFNEFKKNEIRNFLDQMFIPFRFEGISTHFYTSNTVIINYEIRYIPEKTSIYIDTIIKRIKNEVKDLKLLKVIEFTENVLYRVAP